eukprot:Em0012g384a
MRFVFLSLLCSFAVAQILPVDPNTTPDVSCELMTNLSFCYGVGYNKSSFPNFRMQTTQVDANTELKQFVILVNSGCSNAIVHYLCSVYAPYCEPKYLKIPPCANLCVYVRDSCAPKLQQFGVAWPPQLACENWPAYGSVCFGPSTSGLANITIPRNPLFNLPNTTSEPVTATGVRPTSSPSAVNSSNVCPSDMTIQKKNQYSEYTFGGVSGCAVPCSGNSYYFSAAGTDSSAPAFVLVFAITCLLFTFFTVATYLIDRRRFHYPERPIIFLSGCYLFISIAYIVGAVSKLTHGSFACDSADAFKSGATVGPNNEAAVFQRQPSTSADVYKQASCIILFLLVYYPHMAAAVWWVMLTLTWFLAAFLKWGEEAVERFWVLYHIVAWSVPAIQVVIVLALRLVDGDQLAGLCYVGNQNVVALATLVFLPLLVYLVVGVVFWIIGFVALINIREHLSRDPPKARKLCRLVMRIGVYAACYTLPNAVLLLLLVYEIVQRRKWESAVIQKQDAPLPNFPAFLLKYLMIFTVGIGSTSWIMTQKTFAAWHKFFASCVCRRKVENDYEPSKSQTAV